MCVLSWCSTEILMRWLTPEGGDRPHQTRLIFAAPCRRCQAGQWNFSRLWHRSNTWRPWRVLSASFFNLATLMKWGPTKVLLPLTTARWHFQLKAAQAKVVFGQLSDTKVWTQSKVDRCKVWTNPDEHKSGKQCKDSLILDRATQGQNPGNNTVWYPTMNHNYLKGSNVNHSAWTLQFTL